MEIGPFQGGGYPDIRRCTKLGFPYCYMDNVTWVRQVARKALEPN